MNKAKQIAAYKQIAAAAEDNILVADQLKALATRLKVQANTALEELGDSPGRAHRVKAPALSEAEMIKYRAQVTKGGSRKAQA